MRAVLLLALIAAPAGAETLAGQRYIVELSSSQSASGYGDYLLPPLLKALAKSPMKPARGPDADVVVNIVTKSDVGQWVGSGESRQWLYTISVTIGISPAETVLPPDGTPAFGARAELRTPNPDRADEMDCLIALVTRTAWANYRPKGLLRIDGAACGR